MSDIDNMTALAKAAHATPHPQTQSLRALWAVPAMRVNGIAFTLHIDQSSGYWAIYDSAAYPPETGLGSATLNDAMRRKGMIT